MRPKILLADDDRSVRESLRKLLQAEHYDVVLSVDGKDMVEKFVGHRAEFDMVLMDLNMPLRNCWSSIDRLLKIEPLLPIILLTGMSNQRELAKASAVSALVEKPINVPALLQLMRDLLSSTNRCRASGHTDRPMIFQHLPAYDALTEQPQANPYLHWGVDS